MLTMRLYANLLTFRSSFSDLGIRLNFMHIRHANMIGSRWFMKLNFTLKIRIQRLFPEAYKKPFLIEIGESDAKAVKQKVSNLRALRG
ncbi:hypothetical protein VNO77_02091 [Canavalia gladiata]|uniref:Uncharacterized protein n=1 Tax=Canavalia gladiata TaxID=3824 RepID=A0AAN9MSC6_CANGL